MRILHVISSIDLSEGGPARAVLGLARAQVEAGLHVSVLSGYRATDDRSAADNLATGNVQVRLIGPTRGTFRTHRGMSTMMRESVLGCDIVHIHALWEEIQHQAARWARKLGKPYIFRPCGMLDPWSLRQGYWKKRLYLAWRLRRDLNHAAAIHYTAEAERKLAEPLKLRAVAIVEPNGVDLTEFENLPQRGTFRARHPQLGNKAVVLFLSRIHPKKGLDLLIPAFAEGAAKDAMLVLAGPDADGYVAAMQDLVKQHGLTDRVIWTGMLRGRERIEALRDADLFVLPSYQENFGIAIIEALAAGSPVLISDRVNIWSEIKNARLGGVVPPEVDALTGEMQLWLNDRSRRAAAAERARSFVWENYDWRRIAERWARHYRNLLPAGDAVSSLADLQQRGN